MALNKKYANIPDLVRKLRVRIVKSSKLTLRLY